MLESLLRQGDSILIRGFDIIFSLIGLIIGFPIFFLLIIIGWFDTREPFFWQTRVGIHRINFKIVKFRTMHLSSESIATHLANPALITSYGRILRHTKLDELPQLWNVLRGEMSLVGPRPCLPNQHDLIEKREMLGVYKVRPGITGLAQIKGIDMSNPDLLAKIDARMISTMKYADYFKYILYSIIGKGSGDRVRS